MNPNQDKPSNAEKLASAANASRKALRIVNEGAKEALKNPSLMVALDLNANALKIPVGHLTTTVKAGTRLLPKAGELLTVVEYAAKNYSNDDSLVGNIAYGVGAASTIKLFKKTFDAVIPSTIHSSKPLINIARGTARASLVSAAAVASYDSTQHYSRLLAEGHRPVSARIGSIAGAGAGLGVMAAGSSAMVGGIAAAAETAGVSAVAGAAALSTAIASADKLSSDTATLTAQSCEAIIDLSNDLIERAPAIAKNISTFFDEVSSQLPSQTTNTPLNAEQLDRALHQAIHHHLESLETQTLTSAQSIFYVNILENQLANALRVEGDQITFSPNLQHSSQPCKNLGMELSSASTEFMKSLNGSTDNQLLGFLSQLSQQTNQGTFDSFEKYVQQEAEQATEVTADDFITANRLDDVKEEIKGGVDELLNRFKQNEQAFLQARRQQVAAIAAQKREELIQKRFDSSAKVFKDIGDTFGQNSASLAQVCFIGERTVAISKQLHEISQLKDFRENLPGVASFISEGGPLGGIMSGLELVQPYVALTMMAINLGMSLFGRKKGKADPTLQALQQLANQIRELRREMHERFDKLELKLDSLRLVINQGFSDCLNAIENQTNTLLEQTHYQYQSTHEHLNAIDSRQTRLSQSGNLQGFYKHLTHINDVIGGNGSEELLRQNLSQVETNWLLGYFCSDECNGGLYFQSNSKEKLNPLNDLHKDNLSDWLGYLHKKAAFGFKLQSLAANARSLKLPNLILWQLGLNNVLAARMYRHNHYQWPLQSNDKKIHDLKQIATAAKEFIQALQTGKADLFNHLVSIYQQNRQNFIDRVSDKLRSQLVDSETTFTLEQCRAVGIDVNLTYGKEVVPEEINYGNESFRLNDAVLRKIDTDMKVKIPLAVALTILLNKYPLMVNITAEKIIEPSGKNVGRSRSHEIYFEYHIKYISKAQVTIKSQTTRQNSLIEGDFIAPANTLYTKRSIRRYDHVQDAERNAWNQHLVNLRSIPHLFLENQPSIHAPNQTSITAIKKQSARLISQIIVDSLINSDFQQQFGDLAQYIWQPNNTDPDAFFAKVIEALNADSKASDALAEMNTSKKIFQAYADLIGYPGNITHKITTLMTLDHNAMQNDLSELKVSTNDLTDASTSLVNYAGSFDSDILQGFETSLRLIEAYQRRAKYYETYQAAHQLFEADVACYQKLADTIHNLQAVCKIHPSYIAEQRMTTLSTHQETFAKSLSRLRNLLNIERQRLQDDNIRVERAIFDLPVLVNDHHVLSEQANKNAIQMQKKNIRIDGREVKLNEIVNLLQQLAAKIARHDLSTVSGIFILGYTGVGKSTLYNTLLGDNYREVEKDFVTCLVADDHIRTKLLQDNPALELAKEGDTNVSQTLFPNISSSYFDMAGFDDNRSIAHEVCSAFAAEVCITRVKDVKVVLFMVNDSDVVRPRSTDFRSAMIKIGRMLSNEKTMNIGLVINQRSQSALKGIKHVEHQLHQWKKDLLAVTDNENKQAMLSALDFFIQDLDKIQIIDLRESNQVRAQIENWCSEVFRKPQSSKFFNLTDFDRVGRQFHAVVDNLKDYQNSLNQAILNQLAAYASNAIKDLPVTNSMPSITIKDEASGVAVVYRAVSDHHVELISFAKSVSDLLSELSQNPTEEVLGNIEKLLTSLHEQKALKEVFDLIENLPQLKAQGAAKNSHPFFNRASVTQQTTDIEKPATMPSCNN